MQKGEQVWERAKNNVKVLKPRPEELKIRKVKRLKVVEDIDLDVDLEKIRVCSQVRHEPVQVDQEQPEQPGGEDQQFTILRIMIHMGIFHIALRLERMLLDPINPVWCNLFNSSCGVVPNALKLSVN